MKITIKLLTAAAIGVIAGVYLDQYHHTETAHEPPPGYTVIDTIPYYDTIPYLLPVAKQEKGLGTKIVYLPLPAFGRENSTIQNISASVIGDPDDRPDTVAVEIPITQREYEAEEYHAWVSGYDPQLDSIFVFPRREVVTIREPPNRPKRWGIGVFAGYGITPQGFQPCAGISVNYTLWNFLVEPSE